LRATSLEHEVIGFDPDPSALVIARERGMLARVAPSFTELAAQVEVLVLAGPLEVTLAQLADLCLAPPPCALIVDVASVKTPVSLAGRGLPAFVATHPIAGSERSGPAAARADLFEGRIWTIDADAASEPRSAARAFIESLGARVVDIASDEHDRTIALTSHLPQIASVALGMLLSERLGDERTRDLCGTGMRSMLRLGGSAWTVWRAVLSANSTHVAQEVRRLATILSEAAQALETQHVDDLAAGFRAAAAAAASVERAANDRKAES
jgi:prephenate dehydrogenase